jgi:hypothetical protein
MIGQPDYVLRYVCGPVTKQFHADRDSRVKLLIGPFGTGKTSAAAYDTIQCASKRVVPTRGKLRSRFAVVRNTYPELRDTTIKTYLDWFPPLYFGEYNQTEHRLLIEDDNRQVEVLFKALDSSKDVRDLLSLELTGAHVDEAREIHEDVIKGLLGRIGRYPSVKDCGCNPFTAPPQIVLTSNFPSTSHYLYKDFVSSRIDGYAIYQQTQTENKHNLRPGYYEDMEKDYATRPDLLKTLVRGEWGITVQGKLVYPEFNRRVHMAIEPLKPIDPVKIIRGWDNTGLSPAISFSFLSSAGQWRIFKEFCFRDTGIMDAAEAVFLFCAHDLPPDCTYRDICDPAGKNRDTTKQSPADYVMQKNKEYGRTITLEDGIQTFKVRREAVAGRLTRIINGEPAVLIDPSCTTLLDGFEGGYSYREISNSGVFQTEPQDNEYTHIHDAIQYPATRLFGAVERPTRPVTEILDNMSFGGRW